MKNEKNIEKNEEQGSDRAIIPNHNIIEKKSELFKEFDNKDREVTVDFNEDKIFTDEEKLSDIIEEKEKNSNLKTDKTKKKRTLRIKREVEEEDD